MKRFSFILLFFLFALLKGKAQLIVSETKKEGAFPLSAQEGPIIITDPDDDILVQKAAQLFQKDIENITGTKPSIGAVLPSRNNLIIIGSIGKSKFIQQLISRKKINISKLRTEWEGYQIQLISSPFTGVKQALVIAGSDRRGTAYGVLELSKQLGISPWQWWADVPAKKKAALYIKPGAFLADAPKVKYRGIFINDEAPALSGWSKEKFGGFTHLLYEKVFELMLRLKANYLWPAMWGNAFYDDDSLNRKTADEYGIVIGTSHHEPLMRAHDEWRRYGKGKWNYDSNEVRLKQFWKEGMQRATNEKIVSIGMRGDGDEPMTEGTAIALLERIVKDQRQIIKDVTGKPASETPQLWALYKEVQDYYDKGMRVPDDVTLLLCDDNWGNIRKLPKLTEPKRKGGYGIYYHFDYVGGPRNYKWINTNNIARVWEQMHLAWEYGARQIWIVNVGDIKPMELPTSFFLDYAWNPGKWNEDKLRSFYTEWAAEQFGDKYAKEIGDILRRYSQYCARQKPELLDAGTYHRSDYADDEWSRVAKEWDELYRDAEKINALVPAGQKDAFFQLVLHPVKAFRNLHHLYAAAAWNKWYTAQNSPLANSAADAVNYYYKEDSLITTEYHTIIGGKWNHMMDQTHIGYTYWQQPPANKMPEVHYAAVDASEVPVVDVLTTSARERIPPNTKGPVFYEEDGIVSMEAEHWTRKTDSKAVKWKVIPDIGKTGSGISSFPVTASAKPAAGSPHVEYHFYSYDSGRLFLNLYFSPTLNFLNGEGLQFAVSIDNEKPQVVSLNKEDRNTKIWESWVADNIIIKKTEHKMISPGKHVVKYWLVSPAVILQKIVIDFGGSPLGYLGPQETIYN